MVRPAAARTWCSSNTAAWRGRPSAVSPGMCCASSSGMVVLLRGVGGEQAVECAEQPEPARERDAEVPAVDSLAADLAAIDADVEGDVRGRRAHGHTLRRRRQPRTVATPRRPPKVLA